MIKVNSQSFSLPSTLKQVKGVSESELSHRTGRRVCDVIKKRWRWCHFGSFFYDYFRFSVVCSRIFVTTQKAKHPKSKLLVEFKFCLVRSEANYRRLHIETRRSQYWPLFVHIKASFVQDEKKSAVFDEWCQMFVLKSPGEHAARPSLEFSPLSHIQLRLARRWWIIMLLLRLLSGCWPCRKKTFSTFSIFMPRTRRELLQFD